MEYVKIFQYIDKFYSLASKEKLPEDSDSLEEILDNIESIETYDARRRYAERNLEHISSGSSRIVYKYDKFAIKLAKNDKGVAQNRVESKVKGSKYVNEVIKSSKDFSWIKSEFLEDLTEKEFEKLTNLNFKNYGQALEAELDSESKPKDFKKISETSIFKEIKNICNKYDLLPGDISRISSWKKKDKYPVLVDLGFSEKVYEKFYE